ncbi:MAG: cupin domain-containing protein [Acidobacteria bacterium]|nr:cupin domain-containing protein [Acidobacteriota bacterium]
MTDKYFSSDVPSQARANKDFRRVLFTTERSQLVLMTIQPGDEIGEEVHHDIDQILVFVDGVGEAVFDGDRSPVGPGSVVVVPGGTRHNFIAGKDAALKLYTVYSPPEHAPGTVHATKREADEAEHDHHH